MKSALVFGVLVCWLEMLVVIKGQAYFRIKHKDTSKVVEVVYQMGMENPPIPENYSPYLYDRDDGSGADAQKWKIDWSGSGCNTGYFIRNKKYPNKVLTVTDYALYTGVGFVDVEDDSPVTCKKRWLISNDIMKNLDKNYVLVPDGTDLKVQSDDNGSDQEWICDFS